MPAQRIHAFAEKVALITDGATEIGRAVALQLALEGCYVIVGIPETNEENLRGLNELQSIGTLANVVQADVSTLEGIDALFAAVENAYGRLDLLVNTASFTPQNSFVETAPEEFAATIRGNLKTTFFACQAALKLMASRPSPAIVNVLATPEKSANALFAAINYALVGFTESLAVELASKIRVNAVSSNFKPAIKAEITDEFAFLHKKAGVSAEDVARAVTYLLSPEAKAIRGQILEVGEKRAGF